MLPKVHRLTKKKDFDAVFKDGKGIKSGFLIFKILKGGSHSRIGFIVSKKVSGKATVRNRVKRIMRAAVQTHLGALKTPSDIVMVALSGIEKAEPANIKDAVEKVFKKI